MGKLIHIDDRSYRQFTAPKGYGWMGRKGPFGSIFSPLRDVVPRIPRSEWKDRIKAKQRGGLSKLLIAKGIPPSEQDGLNYCWAYGSTGTVETLGMVQGTPYVQLSPESVGGPCSNWRNVGGYAEEAMTQLRDVGACAMSFMDAPNSLSPKRWKTGWEADRANHQIDHEWNDVGDYEDTITGPLEDLPVSAGLDWWGHLVQFTDAVVLGNGGRLLVPLDGKVYTPKDGIYTRFVRALLSGGDPLATLDPVSTSEWDSGEVGIMFRNSWGDWGDEGFATLTESKATPDGAFCPRVVTAH